MKILIAILIFSFIIIFHELGHYLIARRCDVKVNEFQLGLGPKLFGVQRGETLFSIHLLPFGGACAMEGEDEESEDPRAFNQKTVWQRFAIVFGGPLFNFILAYIFAVIIVGTMGYDPAVIDSVEKGQPAAEAGLEAGDEIKSINGYRVHFFREISVYLFTHPGESVDITYDRSGQTKTTTIKPFYDKKAGRYKVGVNAPMARVKTGVFGAVKYGFFEVKYQIYVTFQSLKLLITRKLGISDMSGPVGIVKVIGDTYEQSQSSGLLYVVMNMLSISVLLSANLGVMNLLPFPALDGGRLVFFIIEMIRGKRMNEEIEGRIHLIGFALLMLLMIVVLYNDITKIIM